MKSVYIYFSPILVEVEDDKPIVIAEMACKQIMAKDELGLWLGEKHVEAIIPE